jgi:hypothetical protein
MFSVSEFSGSTPDKEELETVCREGNPLQWLLASSVKGINKGALSVVIA